MIGSPSSETASRPRRKRLGRWRVGLVAVLAVGLIAEQAWFFVSSGSDKPALKAAPLPRQATLSEQVAALVGQALGPSDRGVPRFRLTRLSTDPHDPRLRIVDLTWAINGSLVMGSVSDGAHLDVYLVMHVLYNTQLPIGLVRMVGTFGEQGPHGRDVEVPVLSISLDRAAARAIDWQAMDATTLWPLVHRSYERARFECNCTE